MCGPPEGKGNQYFQKEKAVKDVLGCREKKTATQPNGSVGSYRKTELRVEQKGPFSKTEETETR